jgi:hypothetical protein
MFNNKENCALNLQLTQLLLLLSRLLSSVYDVTRTCLFSGRCENLQLGGRQTPCMPCCTYLDNAPLVSVNREPLPPLLNCEHDVYYKNNNNNNNNYNNKKQRHPKSAH